MFFFQLACILAFEIRCRTHVLGGYDRIVCSFFFSTARSHWASGECVVGRDAIEFQAKATCANGSIQPLLSLHRVRHLCYSFVLHNGQRSCVTIFNSLHQLHATRIPCRLNRFISLFGLRSDQRTKKKRGENTFSAFRFILL